MNNLRQFKIVNEIYRLGSISKAAKSLNISQPTLSKFLSKCEKDLGFEIFDRSQIPLKITERGSKYISAAIKILDAYHQFEKELEQTNKIQQSKIKVGISNSRAPYMLPKILLEFKKKFPNCSISIKERTTNELISDLSNGSLDIIISLLSDGTRNFVSDYLFTETILLACYKDFKQFQVEEILKNTPIISVCKGQRMRKVTNKILSEYNISEPLYECRTIDLGISLVNSGIGCMFVPSYFIENNKFSNVIFKELPNEIVNILGAEIERSVCVFYRNIQFLTTPEYEFIKICKELCVNYKEKI